MAGNPDDPSTWRSVRVPADNCPKCGGSDTSMTMANFDHAEKGGYLRSVEVAYRCHATRCANSWLTSWAMRYIA